MFLISSETTAPSRLLSHFESLTDGPGGRHGGGSETLTEKDTSSAFREARSFLPPHGDWARRDEISLIKECLRKKTHVTKLVVTAGLDISKNRLWALPSLEPGSGWEVLGSVTLTLTFDLQTHSPERGTTAHAHISPDPTGLTQTTVSLKIPAKVIQFVSSGINLSAMQGCPPLPPCRRVNTSLKEELKGKCNFPV